MLPASDAAETLHDAATSCLEQTFEDLELLLIENDSTSATVSVMADLADADERVRIVRAPAGAGFIAALNLGWQMASGRFLARMDSDDVSHPSRIAKQVRLLEDNRNLAACGTLVRILRRGDAVGTVLPPLQGFADYEAWLNSVHTPARIAAERFIDSPISNPSAMIRREVFERLGGYRAVSWAEDYDFWLRLVGEGMEIGKVQDVLLDWFDSDARLTRNDDHYSQDRFLQAKAHFLARLNLVEQCGVGICGAGPIGKRLARLLMNEGVHVAAFYEVSERRIGNVIAGIPVLGSEDLPHSGDQVMIGAVGVSGARDRIRELLIPLGFDEGADFFCVA